MPDHLCEKLWDRLKSAGRRKYNLNLCTKSTGKFKYSKFHNKSRDEIMMTSFRKIPCRRVLTGCKFDESWSFLKDQNCASKTCTKSTGTFKYLKINNKSKDDVIITSFNLQNICPALLLGITLRGIKACNYTLKFVYKVYGEIWYLKFFNKSHGDVIMKYHDVTMTSSWSLWLKFAK